MSCKLAIHHMVHSVVSGCHSVAGGQWWVGGPLSGWSTQSSVDGPLSGEWLVHSVVSGWSTQWSLGGPLTEWSTHWVVHSVVSGWSTQWVVSSRHHEVSSASFAVHLVLNLTLSSLTVPLSLRVQHVSRRLTDVVSMSLKSLDDITHKLW